MGTDYYIIFCHPKYGWKYIGNVYREEWYATKAEAVKMAKHLRKKYSTITGMRVIKRTYKLEFEC